MKFQDVDKGLPKSDEYGTPSIALKPLLPYIGNRTIWEPTDTTHKISKFFSEKGFNVISTQDNFLNYDEPLGDLIITNPPYSKKTEFLKKCFDFKIPFCLLLPITALEGISRQRMYKEHGIQLILFNRRINFVPSKSGSWFAVAWFSFGLNLPSELNFVEIEKEPDARERE